MEEGLKQILGKSIRKNPFTSVSLYINIGSRTTTPEENCLPTTELTLSQTLTLTGELYT